MEDPGESSSRGVSAFRRTGLGSFAADMMLAVLAYAVFLGSQAWLFAFTSGDPRSVALLPCPLPSMDGACLDGVRVQLVAVRHVSEARLPGQWTNAGAPLGAVVWNVGLFAAWGVSHSLMARAWFKARWREVVPAHLERSAYVLVAGLGMALVLSAWQPIAAPALRTEGLLRALVSAVALAGWGIATWATFLVDHLALFGIRPVLEHHGRMAPRADTFVQPAVYRWVRHPMMTGTLLILWAMPDLTPGRLLFAAIGTAYIVVGTHFEERDLLRRFGQPYADYCARTGRFLPHLLRRRAG